MRQQFNFLKNSEYDKGGQYDKNGNWVRDDVPMFHSTIDLDGKVYNAEIFRTRGKWGKEEFILCLETDSDTKAPF